MVRLPSTILVFVLSFISYEAAHSTNKEQTVPAQTQAEMGEAAGSFLKSLFEIGNIRYVDRTFLHPLLFENTPCEIVPFVERDVCMILSPKDRADYSLATINIIWLTFEYQLSLQTPIWLEKNPSQRDPSSALPVEVRSQMHKLVGRAETAEAFKELYGTTQEVEKLMLARHKKMTGLEKQNIQKNSKLIASLFAKYQSAAAEPIKDIPEAFRYEKLTPFSFILARDGGAFKVLWFSFITQ
jgi:hypothetical protein